MKDISLLKDRKNELGYTDQEIADLSGVPLETVQKIFSDATCFPSSDALAAIERILFPQAPPYAGTDSSKSDLLRERPLTWGELEDRLEQYSEDQPGKYLEDQPPEGGYTYADYLALPDDRRVELIDGKFYDMAAPNTRHQIIIGQLHLQFQACAQAHPGCMVLLSPVDVMLDMDDRTVVQPDLMVLCDLSKLRKGRVFGAPDLVIEVISPGSRRMDYGKKAGKYIDAGVREYWIIDYKRRTVVVYDIEHETEMSVMGMDEDIPVNISDGDCKIRMKEIRDYLDALGDI